MKVLLKLILSFLVVFTIIGLFSYFLLSNSQLSNLTAKVTSSSETSKADSLKTPYLLIIILVIISFAVITGASILTAKSIMNPIKNLRNNLSNTKKNKIEGDDEISSLAKEINSKMELKEKEFEEFLDDANDLIQSVNEIGFFIYVNKKWSSTLGYTKEEAKKMNFTKILREDQIPHCTRIFNELKKGKSFEEIKTIFKTKNGKEIFVEGNINAKTQNGELIETRGIFRDVAERKKAEYELEKMNKLMVGRELKMAELKKQIAELKEGNKK